MGKMNDTQSKNKDQIEISVLTSYYQIAKEEPTCDNCFIHLYIQSEIKRI